MEERRHPVSGIDYPGTFEDFEHWFSTESACLDFIAKLRWPESFICPGCGERAARPSLMERGLFLCRKCKRQTSITSGTLFHGSHKPLKTWFLAMWLITSQKHGASALGLKKALGLGSYDTAWSWRHKLRRAMVRPGRDKLTGGVEVDETYVVGVESKVRSRSAKRKTIVAIAAEVRRRGLGRIRMAKIPDLSAPSLQRFFRDNVRRGAELRTDAWSGYNGIEAMGYRHIIMHISDTGDPAHVVIPGVHRVASSLDRWLLGIHQGAIKSSHLDCYLDEFTFRFNRRTSKARGLLFYHLMEQAVNCSPVPRKMIVGGKTRHTGNG
jgi:transposase-like protein